ncbi:MAG: mechanosensitive ion channel [Alphaproteobacteria bacterium]|nr:mechanosensitive ion channel [Alphaproteobacteria bacterium]
MRRVCCCLVLAVLFLLSGVSASFASFGALPGLVFAENKTAIQKIEAVQDADEQEDTAQEPAIVPLSNKIASTVHEIELEETFGTHALSLVLEVTNEIMQQTKRLASSFYAVPKLALWFMDEIRKEENRGAFLTGLKDFLIILGLASLVAFLVSFVLRPLRLYICRKDRPHSNARLKGMGVLGALSLLPIIAGISTAVVFAGKLHIGHQTELVVMSFVYALTIVQLVRVFLCFFFAPHVPNLRFLPISTPLAYYIHHWIMLFAVVIVFAAFLSELAVVFRLPHDAVKGFRDLAGLIVVSMAITVIIQKRASIATFIRGELSAAQSHLSFLGISRLWFARHWHSLAIAYLVIGYMVAVLGGNGFPAMQLGTIGTILSLLFVQLCFYVLSRVAHKKRPDALDSGLSRAVMVLLAKILIWTVAVFGILASWQFDVPYFLSGPLGRRLMGSALTISTTIIAVVFVYEIIFRAIHSKIDQRDRNGNLLATNARARTLLPMVQKIAVMVLAFIVGVVVLGELGINVAPLLAGAGVLGVAIGFGAQNLIKDLLTGLSIILEDSIGIGETVTIADLTGVVEDISIRTVRLRSADGGMHVVPFSSITTITNLSKVFSQAVLDIAITYDSDIDHAMEVIRKTGVAMRKDPALGRMILDDIEILGVNNLGEYSITIRARIRTTPGDQWKVKRAYLLRIKKAFDAERLSFPLPTVVQAGGKSAGMGSAAFRMPYPPGVVPKQDPLENTVPPVPVEKPVT